MQLYTFLRLAQNLPVRSTRCNCILSFDWRITSRSSRLDATVYFPSTGAKPPGQVDSMQLYTFVRLAHNLPVRSTRCNGILSFDWQKTSRSGRLDATVYFPSNGA